MCGDSSQTQNVPKAVDRLRSPLCDPSHRASLDAPAFFVEASRDGLYLCCPPQRPGVWGMRAGTLPGPRPPVSATKRGGGEYTVPTFSTLTENLDMGGHKRYPLKKSMNHYDFADVRGSENSCRRCPRKSESREKERWPSREGASSSPDVRRGAPHHDGPLRAAPEPASTPVDAPDAAPCAAAACFSCCSILERPVSVGGMQSTHHVKRHRTRKKRSTADAQSSFSDGRWPIDSCIARRSLIVFFA